MPYSFNISGAALIRFISAYDNDIDPAKGWRMIPIVGMEMTLKINGLPDFTADAMMKEVYETPWLDPTHVRIEAGGLVKTEGWDFGDLVADRVPRQLLTRIHEQVDNWA
jgi:hypothetical protein